MSEFYSPRDLHQAYFRKKDLFWTIISYIYTESKQQLYATEFRKMLTCGEIKSQTLKSNLTFFLRCILPIYDRLRHVIIKICPFVYNWGRHRL